jgi:hypothetical protein
MKGPSTEKNKQKRTDDVKRVEDESESTGEQMWP